MYQVYQVMNGDTWESMASKFHTDRKTLQAMNGIEMLIPGMMIVVPKIGEKDYFTTYIVEKGDSLYEIARKTGTTVDLLLSVNGLEKDDYLYPGQELWIPKEGTKLYITKDGDTLASVATTWGVSSQRIWEDNEKIYLLPDQLLILKK